MAGRSGGTAAVGSGTQRQTKVTTPSGPHTVTQSAGRQSGIMTPLRGTAQRGKGVIGNWLQVRAGVPTVSPVQTAQVRQRMALPQRTFGMAPVVRTRQMPPLR